MISNNIYRILFIISISFVIYNCTYKLIENEYIQFRTGIDWGYGCGGNCAFWWKGNLLVKIMFNKDHSVELTYMGAIIFDENYPNYSSSTVTTYELYFNGEWEDKGIKRILFLKQNLIKSSITEKKSQGEIKNKNVDLFVDKITLLIEKDHIKVYESIDNIGDNITKYSEVWKCYSKEKSFSGLPEIEFPLFFGIDRDIYLLQKGEPSPNNFYIFESE